MQNVSTHSPAPAPGQTGSASTFLVNGKPVPFTPGQTVAVALLAAGWRVLRRTESGAARGVFCGMGVCFDCQVTVDGLAEQRACMTPVRPGMHVELAARPEDHCARD